MPREDRRRSVLSTDHGSDHVSERVLQGHPERRSFRERRATGRLLMAMDAEVTMRDGVRLITKTIDVSTFGVAILVDEPSMLDDRPLVKLFLPDALSPPSFVCSVVGSVVVGSVALQPGGVRMKFVNPPVESIRRIHRYLANTVMRRHHNHVIV